MSERRVASSEPLPRGGDAPRADRKAGRGRTPTSRVSPPPPEKESQGMSGFGERKKSLLRGFLPSSRASGGGLAPGQLRFYYSQRWQMCLTCQPGVRIRCLTPLPVRRGARGVTRERRARLCSLPLSVAVGQFCRKPGRPRAGHPRLARRVFGWPTGVIVVCGCVRVWSTWPPHQPGRRERQHNAGPRARGRQAHAPGSREAWLLSPAF